MNSTVSKAQHALSFELMGTRVTPIAVGEQVSHWEMFGLDLAPGAHSPLHTLTADKVFVVIAGTVRLTVDDRIEDVAAGGFVHIPTGTAHNYANVSGVDAAMIGLVTGPCAQIEFLRGMSALTADGPPDATALAEHTARHGVRLVRAID